MEDGSLLIDGLFKPELDRAWDRLGRAVARTGLSPNAVTTAAFALSAVNSLALLFHRNLFVFGVLLAFTEMLDGVDGAVARATGRSSRLGSYLDAMTDRYKEVFSLLAVASVTGYWLAGGLAVSGSLLVSYSHARAGLEQVGGRPGGWPDLFERLERVATLCAGLILSPVLP
ncbi:MAG TPA: CDP-alcohol phosphatidyltransferase family protein, partial [Vicinamibacteria bacterium]